MAEKRVTELLEEIEPVKVRRVSAETSVSGITHDSRLVRPGWMFVALPGANTEGARFIDDAVQRGSRVIVTPPGVRVDGNVGHVEVEKPRLALADLAAAFYDWPAQKLTVIGVTGTNGKTTTTHLIRHIWRSQGFECGQIGTVGHDTGQRVVPGDRTTPEAPELQALLYEMVEAGCKAAVLEISSQGLAQDRVAGLKVDAAVFTNLSQDHLDYHGTMEAYFQAKRRLFVENLREDGKAAIYTGDEWGRRLAQELRNRGNTVHRFAENRTTDTDIWAEGIQPGLNAVQMEAITPSTHCTVRLQLCGRYNAQNALAALALAQAAGFDLASVGNQLEAAPPVPGRLEEAGRTSEGALVLVDYAHTEEALYEVLKTLREVVEGRLITVFGCGGGRDQAKRPNMGRVVGEWSDYAVVTSDNPRHERPEDIIADILPGMPDGAAYEVVVDREEAIGRAIDGGGPDDVILVAGKGHETKQEIGSTIVPFDDREKVKQWITART